jgi:LacI family transcriptional regulator
MEQIAQQAGVSKFAVSQALSGKPGVAEDTRTRIIQTANDMGYRRTVLIRKNTLSGSNAPGRTDQAATGTVIILMPNVRFQSRESTYWGRIIDGVLAALADRRVGVMMVTENYSERMMDSINPDGVLGLIGIGYIATPLLLEIRHSSIPFVLIDHEDPLLPSDTLFMNNYDCMRQLTSLIVQSGHREMRFVGNPGYSRSFQDRWLGFRMMLEELQLSVPGPQDPLLHVEEDAYLVVEEEIDKLLSRNNLPSVFVCANDFYANLIIRTLVERGIKVPGTVSVTGFDHTKEFLDPDLPALCTIDVPNETMGKRAVDMLFNRLNEMESPYEKMLISGSLLIGESLKKT